ncbi:hypothetical protein NC651_022780 [Populus alba x Populus x berolinensis]|nr:hypothetical protein NC651_022780 [Populus alba x Populus x berolinensis]
MSGAETTSMALMKAAEFFRGLNWMEKRAYLSVLTENVAVRRSNSVLLIGKKCRRTQCHPALFNYPWASWSVLKSLPSGTEARLLAPQLMRNSSAGLKVLPPADTMLGQESKGKRRTRRIAMGVDNKEGRKRLFFDAFNLFFSISIPPVGEGGMVRVRQKERYQKGRSNSAGSAFRHQ